MLFFPYKFDLDLAKFPWVTSLVVLICTMLYTQQFTNANDFTEKSIQFCTRDRSNIERMAFEKALGSTSSATCLAFMQELTLAHNPKEVIAEYAAKSEKFAAFSAADSSTYIQNFLLREFHNYTASVPAFKTKALWYEPHSWNPITMVTSTFSHGGWDHLFGNMIFFYAFAAAVEVIIGSVAFISIILTMSFGTNVAYSLMMWSVDDALPTVGLSGIVMGMIALLAYLLPKAKIRCFYWVLIKFGTVAISTWILALIYIGIDVYTLMSEAEMGGVNLIAHVSGAALGFILGIIFFRKEKQELVTHS